MIVGGIDYGDADPFGPEASLYHSRSCRCWDCRAAAYDEEDEPR